MERATANGAKLYAAFDRSQERKRKFRSKDMKAKEQRAIKEKEISPNPGRSSRYSIGAGRDFKS
jgi:hypothetical protein